jgi:dipeptidyl aminopeptidase/acylaminoacyl peptidase
MLKLTLTICLVFLFPALTTAEVSRTTVNDGNLVMEDIPAIPAAMAAALNRYQNIRSASFLDWTEDGAGMFVRTRFGDVSQIHRIDHPGGARHQVTFYNEPIGSLKRQPRGSQMVFTMDTGGSEFWQIFLLNKPTDDAIMLSDGESRNGSVVWDRTGGTIAYLSTRRNGSSNDVWVMDVSNPETAHIVLESPDGSYWRGQDFSASGNQLLIENYVGNMDSRVHLLDLETGAFHLLAGSRTKPSSNFPIGFDKDGNGFWYVTDSLNEFRQLAWQSLEPGGRPEIVTAGIPWHVGGGTMNADRTRAAFTVNENGYSKLYLLDPQSRSYQVVDNIPTGVVGGLTFSPDDSSLALTLNTSQTPSDVYVLALGESPLDFGQLERWTFSEVGGLDTSTFVSPELIHYPTFDSGSGGPEKIPAWIYRPEGEGPFPVVIRIHGGPESQARPTFSSTYQLWLKQLGAAVIVPNVRGSSGYGKTYQSLDNGFNREDSVRDIGALLDWIGTQPDLDADRVAVYGGSYGGYMVLASAVHFSDRLKAVVDVVGISNFVTFLENTEDYRRDSRRMEYGDERDPAMRAHLNSISPLTNVDKISVPMLVVQGQNDPRVPATEAEQIVAALREQQQPVWYMNALNEGHGYRKKENWDVFLQAMILFYEKHLLGE